MNNIGQPRLQVDLYINNDVKFHKVMCIKTGVFLKIFGFILNKLLLSHCFTQKVINKFSTYPQSYAQIAKYCR